MSHAQAVGLEQEGQVTTGANANLDVQGARGQRSRGQAELANVLQAANAGPAMRAQVSGKLNQAAAQGSAARHGADYDEKKAMAERNTIQGHNEATQIQAPNASLAESTFGSLNRAI